MPRGIKKTTVIGDTLNNETIVNETPELITKEEMKKVEKSEHDVYFYHKGDGEYRTRTFENIEDAKTFCENPNNSWSDGMGKTIEPQIVN